MPELSPTTSRPPSGSPAPRVAIWRTSWLAPSETFVAHQAAALQRWQPLRIGLRTLPDGLPVVPDLAPFTRTLPSRLRHRISRSLGYRFPFDSYLRRQQVSVLHAHFGPGGVTALPIARRTGIPLVVTFHGFDVTNRASETGPAGDRYRRDLTELFDGAHTLVAVSRFVAERLRILGAPQDKIVVHHIGIPVPPLPSTGDRAGVAFVGRLVEQKGVDVLLEAHLHLPAELRARHPLRIAGFGPLADQLRARTRELDHVELLGRLDQSQVHELLAASAVFAGTPRTWKGAEEAFGLVFLEAAANGLPVVSTLSGGIPDAVADGETGLLVPEEDVAAVTASLHRLLSDPDLAGRMGTAGRRRVVDDFDINRQSALLEQIYDRAAPEPGGRRS